MSIASDNSIILSNTSMKTLTTTSTRGQPETSSESVVSILTTSSPPQSTTSSNTIISRPVAASSLPLASDDIKREELLGLHESREERKKRLQEERRKQVPLPKGNQCQFFMLKKGRYCKFSRVPLKEGPGSGSTESAGCGESKNINNNNDKLVVNDDVINNDTRNYINDDKSSIKRPAVPTIQKYVSAYCVHHAGEVQLLELVDKNVDEKNTMSFSPVINDQENLLSRRDLILCKNNIINNINSDNTAAVDLVVSDEKNASSINKGTCSGKNISVNNNIVINTQNKNYNNNNIRKRIPCPLDPNHSIYEDQLQKHLKKCSKQVQNSFMELQPCYNKGINLPAEVDESSYFEELLLSCNENIGSCMMRTMSSTSTPQAEPAEVNNYNSTTTSINNYNTEENIGIRNGGDTITNTKDNYISAMLLTQDMQFHTQLDPNTLKLLNSCQNTLLTIFTPILNRAFAKAMKILDISDEEREKLEMGELFSSGSSSKNDSSGKNICEEETTSTGGEKLLVKNTRSINNNTLNSSDYFNNTISKTVASKIASIGSSEKNKHHLQNRRLIEVFHEFGKFFEFFDDDDDDDAMIISNTDSTSKSKSKKAAGGVAKKNTSEKKGAAKACPVYMEYGSGKGGLTRWIAGACTVLSDIKVNKEKLLLYSEESVVTPAAVGEDSSKSELANLQPRNSISSSTASSTCCTTNSNTDSSPLLLHNNNNSNNTIIPRYILVEREPRRNKAENKVDISEQKIIRLRLDLVDFDLVRMVMGGEEGTNVSEEDSSRKSQERDGHPTVTPALTNICNDHVKTTQNIEENYNYYNNSIMINTKSEHSRSATIIPNEEYDEHAAKRVKVVVEENIINVEKNDGNNNKLVNLPAKFSKILDWKNYSHGGTTTNQKLLQLPLKMKPEQERLEKCHEQVLELQEFVKKTTINNGNGNGSTSNTKSKVDLIAHAKHLCGGATDLALWSLAKPELVEFGKKIGIATCCHHRCDWRTYVGRDFIEKILLEEDNEVIIRSIFDEVSTTNHRIFLSRPTGRT